MTQGSRPPCTRSPFNRRAVQLDGKTWNKERDGSFGFGARGSIALLHMHLFLQVGQVVPSRNPRDYVGLPPRATNAIVSAGVPTIVVNERACRHICMAAAGAFFGATSDAGADAGTVSATGEILATMHGDGSSRAWLPASDGVQRAGSTTHGSVPRVPTRRRSASRSSGSSGGAGEAFAHVRPLGGNEPPLVLPITSAAANGKPSAGPKVWSSTSSSGESITSGEQPPADSTESPPPTLPGLPSPPSRRGGAARHLTAASSEPRTTSGGAGMLASLSSASSSTTSSSDAEHRLRRAGTAIRAGGNHANDVVMTAPEESSLHAPSISPPVPPSRRYPPPVTVAPQAANSPVGMLVRVDITRSTASSLANAGTVDAKRVVSASSVVHDSALGSPSPVASSAAQTPPSTLVSATASGTAGADLSLGELTGAGTASPAPAAAAQPALTGMLTDAEINLDSVLEEL